MAVGHVISRSGKTSETCDRFSWDQIHRLGKQKSKTRRSLVLGLFAWEQSSAILLF
jgi:hypothetical protein